MKEKVEPLWLPAYPATLPTRGFANFLAALTGIPKAARSYSRSSASMRRCHKPGSAEKVQAITCNTVYPIAAANSKISVNPSSQAANFGKGVLLALRNPLTAFPAWHQYKEEAYHGQVGQVKREAWVEYRDAYVGGTLFAEWKNFIIEWRSMIPYHIAGYLPWEHWTDDRAGPALAYTLLLALKKEGLPVLYDNANDVVCLWEKHIYDTILVEERKRSEEGWYKPEYTPEQLGMIVSELENFAAEIKEKIDGEDDRRPGDRELYEILLGYAKDALETQSTRNSPAQ